MDELNDAAAAFHFRQARPSPLSRRRVIYVHGSVSYCVTQTGRRPNRIRLIQEWKMSPSAEVLVVHFLDHFRTPVLYEPSTSVRDYEGSARASGELRLNTLIGVDAGPLCQKNGGEFSDRSSNQIALIQGRPNIRVPFTRSSFLASKKPVVSAVAHSKLEPFLLTRTTSAPTCQLGTF